jgi:uncharacterized protein (TIGR02302 family)
MKLRQTTATGLDRLERLSAQARLVLIFEKIWPLATAALCLMGLFLTLSFLGLWLEAPRWGRITGVSLFALAFAWLGFNLWRLSWPKRADELARLDRDSGVAHRPATALTDHLANEGTDPATRALWELHRKRMESAARHLRVAAPSPRVVERDRYALRAFALLAVVATAFIAGPEKYARVLAAFDWRTQGALSQGYRLDAWVDPPAYTGKPPIVLNLKDEKSRRVSAPIGSVIIMRSSDASNVSADISGALEVTKVEAPSTRPLAGAQATDAELRWTMKGDGKLTLKRFGSTLTTFELTAIPDRAPTIALKGDVRQNTRGSLTLGYTIDDDYGVTQAEATFSKPIINGRPVTGRSLVEAPKMPLALPAGNSGIGEAETTSDLSEHAWAGARVSLQLKARDEGGNEGVSETKDITLPQRIFVKPLARALVEQRRNLVLAPDDRRRVANAVKALMIAPEQFGTNASIYLGLKSIDYRLARARSDAQLLDVADLMWEMALRIEDGGLSDAERDLRAAQQELRDAMNRGAPEDEIKRLMDQMRAALDKFLNEMMQQAERNQQQNDMRPMDRNAQTITPRDLQNMLNRLEEMMRNGQMADAQRLMEQMQRMLENLRNAQRQRGQQGNQMSREMNRALDELDQMTRDQQELRDNTYRNENGGEGEQNFQQRQSDLRQRLEELQRRMKGMGMQGEQGLDDAEQAMRDAEGELGKGDQGRGKAVDAQGRALEGLRKGAQSLAQQMQQGQPGEEPGEGEASNGPMREGRQGNPDPLGRESHDRRDNSRSTYDPLGVPAAQRAQQVLEELRRRLSDPSRPREELDYLERLLKRY